MSLEEAVGGGVGHASSQPLRDTTRKTYVKCHKCHPVAAILASMSRRGMVATLLLLCLGAGVGFAASYAADPVRPSGEAVPAPASSPSVPTDGVEELTPDPKAPPWPPICR